MRVHHLNCISTCPLGGKLMDGRTESIVRRGHLCCHCLLIESETGLVLVDTGLGLQDVANPRGRLSHFFLTLLRPEFRAEMTAARQVERLGFRVSDVRHIILTHLDFDHAGGLDDFPQATVHLLRQERDYARLQKTWLDRQRFRPQQWSTSAHWQVHTTATGESWFGFARVHPLPGVTSKIVLVPLPGHTHGHTGVAIERNNKWLLLAGDAYFHGREMDLDSPWCTPGLRLYQATMEKDRAARLHNQAKLRDLRRTNRREIEIFCSHDLQEFERLAGRSARIPADQVGHRAG